MAKKYYAHSLEGESPGKWQPLEEYLKNVAEMARSFVDAFNAGDWGYLAGLRHVFGKGDKWIFMLMETRVRS